MQNQRIQFTEVGAASVLQCVSDPVPEPKPGEVRVKHAAIGVNFIDIYHRSGLYPISLPSGLGLEAAGWVDALGEGVEGFAVGDRVAYCSGPLGAYSNYHCVNAEHLLRVPEALSFEAVAASLLKGLTAAYLLHETYDVSRMDRVLVHAAAGGVGQILCRWAKAKGSVVFGTVGREEKRAAAEACGCDAVFSYRAEDFVDQVMALTDQQGVSVVYDGVGMATFEASLSLLQPRGLMVSFGNASGPAPKISPLTLAQRGSLYLTRPTLAHYTRTATELQGLWSLLAQAMQEPWFEQPIGGRYPLADAAIAHQALGEGKTQGALILLPEHAL